jgi:curved DNA-binding protein CbpA
MSKKVRTHYDNLKVARDAPDAVIKAAHKALAQNHHPDKTENKDEAHRIMKLLNEARDVLLDPALRKEHDAWIKIQEANHNHQEAHKRKPQSAKKTEDEGYEWQDWQKIGRYKVRDGLAVDTETGLMWLRFAVGQRWENKTIQGETKKFTWDKALLTATFFNNTGGHSGYTDWKLPTINELQTLVNEYKNVKNGESHFINGSVFSKNATSFWSSSNSAKANELGWAIDFNSGSSSLMNKVSKYSVRLVRREM